MVKAELRWRSSIGLPERPGGPFGREHASPENDGRLPRKGSVTGLTRRSLSFSLPSMTRFHSLPRARLRLGALLVTVLAMLGARSFGLGASRHDPPDVSFEYELDSEKLEKRIQIKEPQYQHWFTHEPHGIPEFSDDEYDAALAELRDFFATHGTVLIDGVEVSPIVSHLEFREALEENDYINFVLVILEYPTKGLPRQISIGWNRYDRPDPTWPLAFVEASFEYDTTAQNYQFYSAEPGVTWHRPALPRKSATRVGRPTAPKWEIPIASLLLFGSVAIAAAFFYTRGTARPLAWGSITTVTLVAVLVGPVAVVEVDPLWEPALDLPNTAAAAQIFEALHRNVYRAFDYETEDEIYDALARFFYDKLIY